MTTVHPPVLWAQRKEVLYITIDVQDCANPKVKLDKVEGEETTTLRFNGIVGENSEVAVQLVLNGEVDSSNTKVSATGRHVVAVIPKSKEGFWPRLTKDKAPRFVSVDWSKWVDEDEEDEAHPPLDMGQFSNIDDFDSDDDEEGQEEEKAKEEDEVEVGESEVEKEQKKTNGTNPNT